MKKTKKTLVTALSFILFIAIMMTTTIIPVSADESAPVTIHYYNENSFTSPYLYYYTDSYNPVIWPGVAMTNDGDGWYSYTVNDYAEIRVIFSDNGSNQNPAQNQPGYLVSGEKWYKNGSFYSTDPDLARLKIHYYNYNAWNSPYVYYYTDGSNPVTWPGAAMTADGDGWYTYEIIGYESARIIFSNNGNNQIPAQNQPGYLREEESWYRNGTWTTSRPDDITVYFYKPSNWSAPNIYYYLNNNDTGPAWPGTAMDEISEGWYSYNITKYDSAKVLFNDGTNQIPAQNQPGLDAEGIMWYKNDIWCDSETDTDEDELPDYMELVLGTNINGTDSDSDGLPDGYEVLTLGTDPTLADSDSNNVSDAAEDADSDGLTNLSEYQLGTDPTVEDSDGDGLSDGDEVTTYLTDPTDEDTDSDGASDGWEIAHNADPLIADVSFNVTVSLGFRDDDVAPSVSAVLPGEQAESLAIEQVTDNEYFINETAGIIGNAYDFTTNGTINSAEISFEFDSDLLLDPDFDPVIYWFDEENQVLEPVATTVTNNVATAQVTHFSMYLLIDEREYLDEFDWVEEYTLYKDYDEIQVVFMIDSSAAMAVSDPNNLRYSHVVSIADSLPLNSKTSVIDFHDDVGDSMDYNGDLFMWLSQYMQNYISDYFYYNIGGTTDIYSLFDYAMTGFDADTQNHTVLREIVILTDGGGLDPSEYSAALAEAKANDVVVSVLAYGASANQSVNGMMPITWATGGTYGTVSALSTFIQRFGNVLDFGTDTDNDGIPDDLEDDLILYNGKTISTDYELADTDEDGLKDGEEVRLEVKYSPDGNYATVVGHLISDPTSEDGDDDGLLDGACKYKNGKVVLPKDDKPLEKNKHADVIKNHYENFNSETLSTYYDENSPFFDVNGIVDNTLNGINGIVDLVFPDFEITREQIANDLVDYSLCLKGDRRFYSYELSNLLHKIKDILDAQFDNEDTARACAAISAYLLNFSKVNNSSTTYHAIPDAWQKQFGYNDLYDDVFDMATSMRVGKNYYNTSDNDNALYSLYVIWAWCGDYWALGAGSEIGLYKYSHEISGNKHFNAVNESINMSLCTYLLPSEPNGEIQSLYKWFPEEKQWWITGFDYSKHRVDAENLVNIGYLDFSGDTDMFEKIYQSENYYLNTNLEEPQKLYPFLNFDSENYYVWLIW